MSKKTRAILFIVCLFFFLLTAPSVILYSQGYRFDWEKKKITQTGAFYFKVSPKNADIYINGKFKKRTSGITDSVLIKNLLPNRYEVEITSTKEGYYSWKKTLEIKEKQATEAKNIILFPENPNFVLVATTTKAIDGILAEINILEELKNSKLSPDEKKVVDFNNYEVWILFRENEKKIFLTRFSEKIGKVFWLNNYYLILNAEDKIKIAEIDYRDRINIIDLAEFKNLEIFRDRTNKKLYVLSEGNLYSLKIFNL